MPRLNSTTFRFVGLVLVILSLGFIVQQFLSLDLRQLRAERWDGLLAIIVAGATIYGVFSMSLSFAWQQLLLWSGETRAPIVLCQGIYGRSQLYKYLPGNLFSLAGRHVLGHRSGLGHRSLAWAAALEILGMIFVSGVLFAAGLGGLGATERMAQVPVVVAALVIPFVLPWIVTRGLQRLPKLRPFALPPHPPIAYLRLYAVFLLYLPFFLVSAGVLWWLLHHTTSAQGPSYLIVAGFFAGAWLLGFITPGASGGMGVRDALLILSLKPFAGDAAVVAAIAYRLVTILGDTLYFLIALAFPLQSLDMSKSQPNSETIR